MRTAVKFITERETGGVLQPEELCTKTGERVMEVLCAKHPDARPPSTVTLDSYTDSTSELVPVDITEYTVTEVVIQLSGGAGLGGGGLGEPPTLASDIWSGKRGVAAGGGRLCGVSRERATPLVRIPCADECPADRTG